MIITKEVEIDMGHRLPNHKGRCRNPHGHRYKIEVGIGGPLNEDGMIIDFSLLKEFMNKEIDETLDHGFMISSDDEYIELFMEMKNNGLKIVVVDFIPTAENMAKWLFDKLKEQVMPLELIHVKVWETPTAAAIYTAGDTLNENK